MTLKPLSTPGSTYESINGGVHRRTASIVGVPSLVRHLGLWDDSADGDPKLRRQAFTDYLADLRAVLEGGAGGTIHVRDPDKDLPAPAPESGVRSGIIRVARFCWHGMQATVRLEFRTEYVMITSILDLSVEPCAEYEAPEDPGNPQRKVDSTLRRLGELFNAGRPEAGRKDEEAAGQPDPAAPAGQGNEAAAAGKPATGPEAPAPPAPQEYWKIARFLQYDLWKAFEEAVLDAPNGDRTLLGGRFGPVFADFRGIVTGSIAGFVPAGEADPDKRRLVQTWREHFKLQPHRERMRQLEHGTPPKGWADDTLQRLWPLIEPDPYLHEYEFTVSGFLAGRALFVTALGPKLPEHIKCGWDWTPVCNFIHCYTDDVWQLGRLVDRIKYLGTLRLAATVEIEPLLDAGDDVNELTAALDLADQAIQEEIDRRTRPAPAKAEGQSGSAGAEALTADQARAAVLNKYRDINQPFSRNDIFYRLERAEYYIDQFTRGAAALRVKRIEGFQKYDEMVARRMSSMFSYVGLMKNRMMDVDARMSALSRAYTSLKAVETTKDIQGLVSKMEGLVTSMNKQDKQIEKIQEFGEIALIGFLIPYYLGATLFHYALHLTGPEATAWWLGTTMLFAWIVALRGVFRMERDGFRSTAGTTLVCSVVYMLIVMVLLGPHLLHGK